MGRMTYSQTRAIRERPDAPFGERFPTWNTDHKQKKAAGFLSPILLSIHPFLHQLRPRTPYNGRLHFPMQPHYPITSGVNSLKRPTSLPPLFALSTAQITLLVYSILMNVQPTAIATQQSSPHMHGLLISVCCKSDEDEKQVPTAENSCGTKPWCACSLFVDSVD